MTVSLKSGLSGLILGYRSPSCPRPKDAKFVLIGELHNTEAIQRAHARFIEDNCTSEDVLLVESCEARFTVIGKKKKSY